MLLAIVIRQLRGLTGPHIRLLNAQSQAGEGRTEFTVTWMKRMRHTACESAKFANNQGKIEGIAHRGSSTMYAICCDVVEPILFCDVVEPILFYVVEPNLFCYVVEPIL